MTENTPYITVLRQNTHGLPTEQYANELRDRLPDTAIQVARTPAEEHELISETTVVSGTRIRESLLENAKNLRLFAGAAAGYDHLPLEQMQEMGVAVTNASGIHAPNIAEQVLGYLLSFTRRLHEGQRRTERGEWRHYQAYELKDSTVTIIGLGAIGTAVTQRLKGFEVDTIGIRYTPDKGGPTDEVIGFESDAIHRALADSDHVVLAAPLSDTTRGLIGEEEFKTLSPHATLINVGRGQIVNTDALVGALQSNGIRAAALDVTDPEPLPSDHPLWTLENAFITPHNAGHSPQHWSRLADIVAGNVRTLRETGTDEKLENLVQSSGQ